MKKLNILIVSALLLTLFVLPSCKKISGEGAIVTEQRSVADFKEIRSDISGNVYVTEGTNYEVRIEAQQNIIDVIETVLNANILTVRVKNNTTIKNNANIKVYITLPKLNGVTISGSGNVQALSDFNTDDLFLKISGSGNMRLNEVIATNVDAKISGSGEMSIGSGSVTDETIDISGSGSIDFINLQAKNGDIKISGSGNARVFVTDKLKVRISGSGDVVYKGTPLIDVSTSGSGSLKPL